MFEGPDKKAWIILSLMWAGVCGGLMFLVMFVYTFITGIFGKREEEEE